MRPVVRYQMQLPLPDKKRQYGSIVKEIVEAWLISKISDAKQVAKTSKTKPSEYDFSQFKPRSDSHDGDKAWGYTYSEKGDVSYFETIIDVAETPSDLWFDLVIRAELIEKALAPQFFGLYRPRLIKNLLSHPDLNWQYGPTPLIEQHIPCVGTEGGESLSSLILDGQRKIPIIVVSEDTRRPALSQELAELIQDDLLGLSFVACCDSAACWELSSRMRPTLGVYGGAARLYWPGLRIADSRWAHPLAELPRGLKVTDDDWWARADGARSKFRRTVFGVSAIAPSISSRAAEIYRGANLAKYDANRNELIAGRDYQALAESYAQENDELKSEQRKLKESLAQKDDIIANLNIALLYQEENASEEEKATEYVAPNTVSEAIERAERDFSEQLVFGDDIYKTAETLVEDAGPPERIYQYLYELTLLANEKRKGPLGKTDLKWLQDRNISASQESDTIRNSKTEMRKRQWKVGGAKKQFDNHMKPTDGIAPDRCVRIYFGWNSPSEKFEVAYIGKHID